MSFTVIDNTEFQKFRKHSGFSTFEFRQLAGLFSRAAMVKALFDIAVDVDFDEHVCTFTYYRSPARKPHLQFVIRRVGPQTDMYEVYRAGAGRIARSGLFSHAFEDLEAEVNALIEDAKA